MLALWATWACIKALLLIQVYCTWQYFLKKKKNFQITLKFFYNIRNQARRPVGKCAHLQRSFLFTCRKRSVDLEMSTLLINNSKPRHSVRDRRIFWKEKLKPGRKSWGLLERNASGCNRERYKWTNSSLFDCEILVID